MSAIQEASHGQASPLGTLSVVAEWENAGDLADETALANILNLAARILEAKDLVQGTPTLVMVSDPLVSSRVAFERVVDMLRKRYGNQLTIKAIDAPGAEYTDQKHAGVAATDSDILVFADSDCRYNLNWLPQLLAPLSDSAVDYSHGRNVMMTGDIWGQAAAVYWFYPLEQEVPDGPNGIYFSNLAIRRKTYRRHPFPGRPGNRVACNIWIRGILQSGLVGRRTLAKADHPPAYGLAGVYKKAVDYGSIDDGRYVARGFSRPARLARALIRLVREILHSLKRSLYVGYTLRLNPLRVLATLGIGLLYAVVTGLSQIRAALFDNPPVPSKNAEALLEVGERTRA